MLDCLIEFSGIKTRNIVSSDTNPISNTPVTFRFSRFTTSHFTNGVRDSNGQTVFLPFIETPSIISNSIDMSPQLGGEVNVTFGGFVLANHTLNKPLNYLRNYEFTGQTVKQWFIQKGGNYDPNTPDLQYTIESIMFSGATVTFTIKTDRVKFEQPILTEKYRGDNGATVDVLGLEGRTQLKDTLKPLLLGRVNNFSPILCNDSLLIYQISTSPTAGIINVFTKGSYLTRSSPDYTYASSDSGGLQDIGSAPPAGTYRVYSGASGTFIRLGSAVGQITITGWQGTTFLENSAAGILKTLLDRASIAYSQTSLDALDSANCASVGLYITDSMTYADAFTKICQSIGAFWGRDNIGTFVVKQVSEPDQDHSHGDFDYEFQSLNHSVVNAYGIESLEIKDYQLEGKAAPLWQLIGNSDRNLTVMDSNSLAGIAVDSGRQDWFGKEWRTNTKEEPTIKTNYPLASSVELEYVFSGQQACLAENARRFDMFSKKREIYAIVARLPLSTLKSLYSGQKVWVNYPELLPSGGANGLIINYDPNYESQIVTLDLWV